MGPIFRALGVQPDEQKPLRAVIVACFFLGLALVLYQTTANALFLTAYAIDALPYIYILSAVSVIACSYAYGALGRRADFRMLQAWTLGGLAVISLGVWALYQASQQREVLVLMVVWYRVLFIYTTLGLWELAARLFDIRQGKRLFSLVGLGVMLGFIAGGATVSLWGAALGTQHVLLASVVLLLVYLARVWPLLSAGPPPQEDDPPPRLGGLLRERYVLLILAMKVLGMVVYYLIEFVFYGQAAARYTDEAGLANFLGGFLALTTLVMVVMTALAAGPYITRFGLRVALLTMPLTLAVWAGLGAGYGALWGTGEAFFWLVATLKLSNDAVERAVHHPAGALVYQPLPRHKRLAVRLLSEGWVGSVSLIGSGLLLILLSQWPDIQAPAFLGVLFALCLVFVGVMLALYRAYQDQLDWAVTTRFVSGVVSTEALGIEADIVQQHLSSDHPGQIIAALQYADSALSPPLVKQLLRHPEPSVRRNMLEYIAMQGYSAALPQVRGLLDADEPRAVRGQALATWVALSGGAVDFTPYLAGELREDALRAWLTYGEAPGAVDVLARLADDPAERPMIAALLQDAPPMPDHAPLTALLARLLDDPAPEIRGAAVAACAPHLTPDLARRLLDDLPRLPASALADVLAGYPPARDLLRGYLTPETPLAQYTVALNALAAGGASLPDIAPLVTRETRAARDILGVLRQYADDDLLGPALRADLAALRARLFHLAALHYDAQSLRAAAYVLNYGTPAQRPNALELLDVTLGPPLKPLLWPLISGLSIDAAYAKVTTSGDEPPDLDRLPEAVFSPWTRACAVFVLGGKEPSHPMYTQFERVMILRSVDIFAQTPDPVLADIAQSLQVGRAAPGHVLIEKGALGNRLYILIEGRVRVYDGATTIRTIGDRGIVGELAVLDPAPRVASVAAEVETTYFTLTDDTLFGLMRTRPEIIRGIIKVLVERLRQSTAYAQPE